jgi:hypothetical protein
MIGYEVRRQTHTREVWGGWAKSAPDAPSAAPVSTQPRQGAVLFFRFIHPLYQSSNIALVISNQIVHPVTHHICKHAPCDEYDRLTRDEFAIVLDTF